MSYLINTLEEFRSVLAIPKKYRMSIIDIKVIKLQKKIKKIGVIQ